MNLLVDELPQAVEIDRVEYPINSDFRNCLQVILAFEDNELTAFEKQMILLSNLYPALPHDLGQAIGQAVKFLNGGQAAGNEEQPGPRVYSFSNDANLIFAAFKQTHGIDLINTEYLHWWAFLALFMDLGSETTFCSLVALRKRVKTGKATKEERQAAREMGNLFEVPEVDTRMLEEREREAEFMRLVTGRERTEEWEKAER